MNGATLRFSAGRVWDGLVSTVRRRWLPLALILLGWGIIGKAADATFARTFGVGSSMATTPVGYAVGRFLYPLLIGSIAHSLILGVWLFAPGESFRRIVVAGLKAAPVVALVTFVLRAPHLALREGLVLATTAVQGGEAGYWVQVAATWLSWPVDLGLMLAAFAAFGLARPVAVADAAMPLAALREGWSLGRPVWGPLAIAYVAVNLAPLAMQAPLMLLSNDQMDGSWVGPFLMIYRLVPSVGSVALLMLSAEIYLEARRSQTGAGAEPMDHVFG